MPYKSTSELPKSVRDSLPAHAQEIFRAAFNSAYSKRSNDVAAMKVAWAAVKQSYEKKDGTWVKKAAQRKLSKYGEGLSRMPLTYEAGALATLRPDQIPRMLGAITHPELLEEETLEFDDLVAIQNRVSTAKVEDIATQVCDGEPCGVVAKFNGKNYILDGHHRIVGRWLAGDENVKVNFINLQPISNAMKGREVNARICKVDDSLGIVFGWGMICRVEGEDYFDAHDEHIPEDVMLRAVAEFMTKSRVAADMHIWDGEGDDEKPVRTGEVVFAFPLTEEIAEAMGVVSTKSGLMIGMKPDNPEILQKYSRGEYTGFSIGGKALKKDA